MAALALGGLDESERVRWGLSLAAVLAFHVGLGAWLLPRVVVLDPGAPPPAVIVDLAPAEVATAEQPAAAPPVEPPPPPEVPAEAPAEPPQAALPVEEPPVTPDPPVRTEPVPEAARPEVAVPKPELPKPNPERVRPKPRPPEPKVAKPEPKPQPKPEPRSARKPEPERARSAEGARSRADSRAGPQRTASITGGPISGPSPNLSGWHASVRARLQSLQRYPAEAQARGESGTAVVAFVIDRSGRVVSARLAGSSGSPVLDQASLGMVRTASLPPPPPDVPGSSFPFTIPLRYRPR